MGSQDESSLAARRARLRGSLTKQALPADPYSQDQYARAKTPEPEKVDGGGGNSTAASANSTQGSATVATNQAKPISSNGNGGAIGAHAGSGEGGSHGGNGSGTAQPQARPSFKLEDLAATQQLRPAIAPPNRDFAAMSPKNGSANSAPPNQTPVQSQSALSSHMPTSGGASAPGLSNLGNFGLGSLSESLKSLSRNPNSPSEGAGGSALTDIADWSTAEPDAESDELNLDAAQAVEDIQNEVNFEGEFASIESPIERSAHNAAGFFDSPEESQSQFENAPSFEVAQAEPEINDLSAEGAIEDDDEFFRKQREQKAAAAEEFESAIQEIMAKEAAAERIAAEAAATAIAAPLVAREAKNKKATGRAAKINLLSKSCLLNRKKKKQ